jgi:hypothetical protein
MRPGPVGSDIGDEQGRDSLSMWDMLPWFFGFAAGAPAIAIVANH